jgi:hypothetical protein
MTHFIKLTQMGKTLAFFVLTLLSLVSNEELHAQDEQPVAGYIMVDGNRIDFPCGVSLAAFKQSYSMHNDGIRVFIGQNPIRYICDGDTIYKYTPEEWAAGIRNITKIAHTMAAIPCPNEPEETDDNGGLGLYWNPFGRDQFGSFTRPNFGSTARFDTPNSNRTGECFNTIEVYRRVINPDGTIKGEYYQRTRYEYGVPCPGEMTKEFSDFQEKDCCEEERSTRRTRTPRQKPPVEVNGWDMFAGGEFGRFDDQLSPTYVGVRFGTEYNWDHLYAGGNFSIGYLYSSPYHDRPFLQSAYDDQVETWGRGMRGGKAGIELLTGYQTKKGFRVGVMGSFNSFVQPEPLKLESASSSDVWKNRADRPAGYWSGGITVGYKSRNAQHPFSIEAVGQITTDVSFWSEPRQVGDTKEPNTFFGGTWHQGSGNFLGLRATAYFR